jgi:glucosamine-6-phosphate deaminase
MMTDQGQPEPVRVIGPRSARVYADRQALGRAAGLDAAERIRRLLAAQQQVTIVFAAAPSQNEFLESLAAAPDIDWQRVIALHMDEYIGLQPDAPQRFGNFLRERIWDKVRPGGVYYLDGSAPDAKAECARYSELLRANPVDIVCAGIGENGHLAFNDPGIADFADPHLVKVVPLAQESRIQQVHDGCFGTLDQVPTHALTLTVPALMAGRWIYCMVPGPTKTAAVTATLRGPISPTVPASILRIHPRMVLYLDLDSAAGVM